MDPAVYDLTRAQVYERLAVLGESSVGVPKATMLQWLIPPKQPNGNFPAKATAMGNDPAGNSNAMSKTIRQIVKYHRKRGVHVTPTVFLNGETTETERKEEMKEEEEKEERKEGRKGGREEKKRKKKEDEGRKGEKK